MYSPPGNSPTQSPDSPGLSVFPDLSKPLKLSFFNDEIIENKKGGNKNRRGSCSHFWEKGELPMLIP